MSMSTAEPLSNRVIVIVMPQDQESGYCEVIVEIAGYHLRKPSPYSRGEALTVARKVASTLGLSEVPRGPDQGENYAVYFRSLAVDPVPVAERTAAQSGVAVAPGETDSSARARARAVLAPGQRVRTAPEYQARWAGMHGVVRWVANGYVRVDLDGGESVTCGPRELVAGLTVEQQGVLAWLGETTNGRRILDDIASKVSRGPLLPGGRRAEVFGLPVFDADGRQIGDAVLAGITVTARVTDEHAAAVLRASANLRGSVGYRVRIEADPVHPAPHKEPVAPPTDARLREIVSGECGPNRQEVAAMASGLLLSRNAIRYHEEYDRLLAAAQAADPAIAAIAATCEHRFFDDAGSRVYLYCQRGCGTRDPLESATPATADERGR